MIKKIIFTILAMVMITGVATGADKTVVVTWNANTESDMSGYTGYQYASSTATTPSATWTVNHPTTTKSIVLNVPDNGSSTICVELDAYDLNNNHSTKTSRVCATIPGNDTLPPGAPTNVRITVTTP